MLKHVELIDFILHSFYHSIWHLKIHRVHESDNGCYACILEMDTVHVACVQVISNQAFLTQSYEEQEEKRRRKNRKFWRQINLETKRNLEKLRELRETKRNLETKRNFQRQNAERMTTKNESKWPGIVFILVVASLGSFSMIFKAIFKIRSAGVQGERQLQQPRVVSLPTLGETETVPTAPPTQPSAETVPTAPQVRVVHV